VETSITASPDGFKLQAGEFVVVAGPSGAGKTTLLRLIAGLDRPTAGRIEIAGREVSSPRRIAAPMARQPSFQGLAGHLLDDEKALALDPAPDVLAERDGPDKTAKSAHQKTRQTGIEVPILAMGLGFIPRRFTASAILSISSPLP
jgi:ABC-type cobalamin/Fe3+-siderophores transport system ATPase subunit